MRKMLMVFLALVAAFVFFNPVAQRAVATATAEENASVKTDRLPPVVVNIRHCVVKREWSEDYGQNPYLRKVRICT